MLPQLYNKEDIRGAKKALTKISNKLQKKAYKFGETMRPFTEKAMRDFSFGDKSPIAKSVWHFHSYHPFAKSILEDEQYIEVVKDKYPNLAEVALKVHSELKPLALEVKELEEHIESEKQRLSGTTAQQFLRSASKSKDLTDKNKQAMIDYANTLKNWKAAFIDNGEIIVNGNKVGKEAFVGVMIGKGIRVHPMHIYIGTHTSKESGIKEEVIFIKNYTQWNRSDLVILDIMDNIPDEVIARK